MSHIIHFLMSAIVVILCAALHVSFLFLPLPILLKVVFIIVVDLLAFLGHQIDLLWEIKSLNRKNIIRSKRRQGPVSIIPLIPAVGNEVNKVDGEL